MKTTVNGSSSRSCTSLIDPVAAKIGYTIAYISILVISLIGNFLIGIIVYKTPSLRKPINLLIANMAMSDLLYPIFLFPVRLVELHSFWLTGGTLGKALCKLHAFLADVSTLVSIQSLVLIAVDRFGAVVVPLRSPLISRKLCPFFILATWIVATAVYSPYLVTFKLVEYPRRLMCERQWKEAFGETTVSNYFLARIIVFCYIPPLLLLTLYSIILIKLKHQAHPGEQSANAEEHRKRRIRNVLKMAIAIIVAFLVCWIPFSTALLLRFLSPGNLSCMYWLFFDVANFIASANCAFNPLICFTFSSNYCQGLKKLLTCFGAVHD